MTVTRDVRRTYSPDIISNFTGGMAYPAARDSEFERLENFEISRDGYALSRLGCTKHNTNNIGTATVTGFGQGTLSSIQNVVMASKSGLTWYYKATPFTAGSWTALTVPQNLGTDPVHFEQAQAAGGTTYLFATNQNAAGGIMYWDGTNPVASIGAGPTNATVMAQFGQQMYASGMTATPFTIRFSNVGDPLTWPTANAFDVPATNGVIQGILRFPGIGLVVFCERGIWQMMGTPPFNMRLLPLHDRIGTDLKQALISYGNAIFSSFQGDLNLFTGSITNLTEKLRGLTNVGRAGTAATTQLGYLTATPLYFFFRPNMRDTPDTAAPLLYCFDRERGGWMSVWSYSTTATLFGASGNPTQPTCFAVGNQILMGGGDGNIYTQTTRFIDLNNVQGVFETPVFTQDDATPSGSVDVTSYVRTRIRYIGDPGLIKQSRVIQVSGRCNTGTAVLIQRRERLAAAGGTEFVVTTETGRTMPFESHGPAIYGADLTAASAGASDYLGIQFEVQAQRMMLVSICNHYRGVRWSSQAVLMP